MPTFRVVRGFHAEGRGKERKLHRQGSYVASDLDLDKKFGSNKFRRVSDDKLEGKAAKKVDPMRPLQPKPVNDGLDQMSSLQLKELAADEEINIDGIKTKSELIKTIRETR